jgi:hypothetical protein
VVLVLLQVERVGSLVVVTVVVFVVVALVGKVFQIVLTPLLRKWLGTGFMLTVKIRQPSHEFTFGVGMSFIPYPLVLTPVV